MFRPKGLTDAQWEQLQADTNAQRVQPRWWIRDGELVQTVRDLLSEAEKDALNAWWLQKRGAPTAQEQQRAQLSVLVVEGFQVSQRSSYPSEPPRLEAVSLDYLRIRLDCLRPRCEGEVVVMVYTRGHEYTFEATCPDCLSAYRPAEEATVLRLAKEFHDNWEPSEAALTAWNASGVYPGEAQARQAQLMTGVKR